MGHIYNTVEAAPKAIIACMHADIRLYLYHSMDPGEAHEFFSHSGSSSDVLRLLISDRDNILIGRTWGIEYDYTRIRRFADG